MPTASPTAAVASDHRSRRLHSARGLSPSTPRFLFSCCFPSLTTSSCLSGFATNSSTGPASALFAALARRDKNRPRLPSGGATSTLIQRFSATRGSACTLTCATDSRKLRHEGHRAMCWFNSYICAPPSCPVAARTLISSYCRCRLGQCFQATWTNWLCLLMICPKSCPQSGKSSMQIVPHCVHRFTQAHGDFFRRQTLVVRHFHNGALPRL